MHQVYYSIIVMQVSTWPGIFPYHESIEDGRFFDRGKLVRNKGQRRRSTWLLGKNIWPFLEPISLRSNLVRYVVRIAGYTDKG